MASPASGLSLIGKAKPKSPKHQPIVVVLEELVLNPEPISDEALESFRQDVLESYSSPERKQMLLEWYGVNSENELPRTGRPSRYRPEYCQKAIEIMAVGRSKKDVAVHLGIRVETLYEWEKQFLEFSNAIKIGELLSEYWWKEIGRVNLFNANFNHVLWMMNMSNRHGWSRKVDGNIGIDATTTNRTETIERKEYVIRTDENAARVLEILAQCGAIKPQS